jgi:hypothetical protein
MLDLDSIVVNYGLQTFDSSIRCGDGHPRIAWHFCDPSATRRENDRFLSLPVWRNCDGYLLSFFGTFPGDSEAGVLSGVRHGISDAWQLGILFRRHVTNRGIRRDNRVPGATLGARLPPSIGSKITAAETENCGFLCGAVFLSFIRMKFRTKRQKFITAFAAPSSHASR